jgi:uroporphyrinogen decarboxylase
VYLEGPCDSRVEYFLDLPKGKFVLRFEQSDIFRAKAILDGHCCISGNVPSSMMQVGSPQEVDEYCRKLIKVCGKGGGFILSPGTALTRHSRPENVRALRDSVERYGKY